MFGSLDSVASHSYERLYFLTQRFQDNVLLDDWPTSLYQSEILEMGGGGGIDGRKLTSFLHDNRPGRRFLYRRYTLAWLDTEDNK